MFAFGVEIRIELRLVILDISDEWCDEILASSEFPWLEGCSATDHFVENNAQHPDVHWGRVALLAYDLWGQVLIGARHRHGLAFVLHHACPPEVCEFDLVLAGVVGKIYFWSGPIYRYILSNWRGMARVILNKLGIDPKSP